jgi:hypothetical protein
MQAIRTSFLGLAAAGAVLCGAAAARADGPMVLTPRQLDRVTAGSSAIVISSTDAQASGVVSLATTTSNSVVTGGVQPFAGQPNLTNTGGAADGTALAVGTNLGFSGNPAPSTGTSVVTAGAADGNLVVNSTINHTVQGAGGVTFQAGWTFVYGAWVGL